MYFLLSTPPPLSGRTTKKDFFLRLLLRLCTCYKNNSITIRNETISIFLQNYFSRVQKSEKGNFQVFGGDVFIPGCHVNAIQDDITAKAVPILLQKALCIRCVYVY